MRGSGAPGEREEGRPAGRTRSRAVGKPASPEHFSSHPSSHRVTAAEPEPWSSMASARVSDSKRWGKAGPWRVLSPLSPLPSAHPPPLLTGHLHLPLSHPPWAKVGDPPGRWALKACGPCSQQGPLSPGSGVAAGSALLSLPRHSEQLLTQTLYPPFALSPLLYFFWKVLSWTSTIYFLSISKRVCAQRFLSLFLSRSLSLSLF